MPLAVLALAAPAAADGGGKHATTYRAELAPVVAGPVATPTRNEDEAAKGVRGKAKLVDGPRRDMVRLHVRGLAPGSTYSWSVRQASGEDDACAGEAVDAFGPSSLNARRRGRVSDRARSRTFTAEDGARYAIVVTDDDGADVACGAFESKASRKSAKGKSGKGKDGKRHGEGSKSECHEDEADAGELEPEAEEPGPEADLGQDF